MTTATQNNLDTSALRAVMYHYVRQPSARLPHFFGLAPDSFQRQIEMFMEVGPILTGTQLRECVLRGSPMPGTILTFDDGVKDHSQTVLPVLQARKAHGIFYICAGPLIHNKILDVHRVHLLLGLHGGRVIYDALLPRISAGMLMSDNIEAFERLTYARQQLDDATKAVKEICNYYLRYELREPLLDELCSELLPPELCDPRSFYMDENEILALHKAGMTIGSHSISHYVMSRVSVEVQQQEITASFSFLESIVGTLPTRTFCFPYGGFHSFTADTVRLLDSERCAFSFNVEQATICAAHLSEQPLTLPRFDCNQFPYGTGESFAGNARHSS